MFGQIRSSSTGDQPQDGRGKYHCTAVILFDWFGFSSFKTFK